MPSLVEALSFSSLVAGTLEYAILVRHRAERRRPAAERSAKLNADSDALWRMGMSPARQNRRWQSYGTRYR